VSRSLGPAIPDGLLARLLGPVPATPLDGVIVLVTVDPVGWPHPALLSYAELLALDAGRLRVALRAGSRSAQHLRDSGRATLLFADAELCCYVKGEALALSPAPRASELARFELVVRDVLDDRAEGAEAGARLATGLTVAWPRGIAWVEAHAARVREALRH
jgi:hypothetical protein